MMLIAMEPGSSAAALRAMSPAGLRINSETMFVSNM